jgi:hypothetical protein
MKMKEYFLLLNAVFVLVLAACSDPTGPATGPGNDNDLNESGSGGISVDDNTLGGLYAGTNTTPVNLSSYSGNNLLDKAIKYLQTNAKSNTTYTIAFDSNIETKGYAINSVNLNNASNVIIVLTGVGSERTIQFLYEVNSASGFTVLNGQTLILDKNITLKGISGPQPNRGQLVFVNLDGIFIMKEGAKITGNDSGGSSPAGVEVSTTGTFIMEGGTISNNSSGPYGAGVGIMGTFTQKGGTITGNTARGSTSVTGAGGGVYVWASGTYNFEGGSVSGNSISGTGNANNGPQVYVNTAKSSYGSAPSGTLILKGSDNIEVLLSDPSYGYVNITGAFSGNAQISLYGSAADWEDKAIVKAGGNSTLSSIPAGISLGNFVAKTSYATTPIDTDYELKLIDGQAVLKEKSAASMVGIWKGTINEEDLTISVYNEYGWVSSGALVDDGTYDQAAGIATLYSNNLADAAGEVNISVNTITVTFTNGPYSGSILHLTKQTGDLPVKTISWLSDGNNFFQFYTNDTGKLDSSFWGYSTNKNTSTPETYSVELKKIAGYNNASYGMIFCTSDGGYFYYVLISTTGYYLIGKHVPQGHTTIKEWAKSSALRTGYCVSNVIKAVKSESGYGIYLNNILVYNLADLDPDINGSEVGCYTQPGNLEQENFPNIPMDIRYQQKL